MAARCGQPSAMQRVCSSSETVTVNMDHEQNDYLYVCMIYAIDGVYRVVGCALLNIGGRRAISISFLFNSIKRPD